jgi:hypothetical protein
MSLALATSFQPGFWLVIVAYCSAIIPELIPGTRQGGPGRRCGKRIVISKRFRGYGVYQPP